MLTRVSGRSVKENIHRALKKLFTNSCAKQCSWMGRKNNFKVSDLKFVKMMKGEFTKNDLTNIFHIYNY